MAVYEAKDAVQLQQPQAAQLQDENDGGGRVWCGNHWRCNRWTYHKGNEQSCYEDEENEEERENEEDVEEEERDCLNFEAFYHNEFQDELRVDLLSRDNVTDSSLLPSSKSTTWSKCAAEEIGVLPTCQISVRTLIQLDSYASLRCHSAICMTTFFTGSHRQQLAVISNGWHIFVFDLQNTSCPLLRSFHLQDGSSDCLLFISKLTSVSSLHQTQRPTQQPLLQPHMQPQLQPQPQPQQQQQQQELLFAAGKLRLGREIEKECVDMSNKLDEEISAVICFDIQGHVKRKRQYAKADILEITCQPTSGNLILLLQNRRESSTEKVHLVILTMETLCVESVHSLARNPLGLTPLLNDSALLVYGLLQNGGTFLHVWPTTKSTLNEKPEMIMPSEAWALPRVFLRSVVALPHSDSGHLLAAVNSADESSLWLIRLLSDCTTNGVVLARRVNQLQNNHCYLTALAIRPCWGAAAGSGLLLGLKENSLILMRRRPHQDKGLNSTVAARCGCQIM